MDRRAITFVVIAFFMLATSSNAFGGTISTQEIKALKLSFIKVINSDRAKNGLPAVVYDENASRVADGQAFEMASKGYLSHWNTNGLKPYHRYSIVGGVDYSAENAYAMDTTGTFEVSSKAIWGYMLKAEEKFISQKPPEDGHRRNILNPYHTHVGIGISMTKKKFRLVQLFINRYLWVESFPRNVNLNREVTFSARPYTGYEVASIGVFYEPLPAPMSIQQLDDTSSYGLPEDYILLLPKLKKGWHYDDGSSGDIMIDSSGRFSVPIKFYKDQEGIYTIVVFLKQKGKEEQKRIEATAASIWVQK